MVKPEKKTGILQEGLTKPPQTDIIPKANEVKPDDLQKGLTKPPQEVETVIPQGEEVTIPPAKKE